VSDFKTDRETRASEYSHDALKADPDFSVIKGVCNDDIYEDSFRDGADWGFKWANENGVTELNRWMQSVEAKRNIKLEGVIRVAAGLISTMDQFKDKHPQLVEQWLYDQHALFEAAKEGTQ